jgi:hypothetical protein
LSSLSKRSTPFPYNTITATIVLIFPRIDMACDVEELKLFLPPDLKASHGVVGGGKT